MEIQKIHARYPERKGFHLHRPDTGEEYIFVHFLTPSTAIIRGETVAIGEGACVFFPKHANYTLANPEHDLLHDWFHATGDVDELLSRYGLEFETVYYPTGHEFVTELIAAIESEKNLKYPYADRLCALKAEELIAKLARFCALPPTAQVAPTLYRALCEVRETLHTHFSEDWTVEKMAALLNLSPSYFHALYKAAFGIAPKHDLGRIRLRHAASLLKHSNLNMNEVSEKSGFRSPFHFIRSFKNAFGTTPNQYRIAHNRK